MPLLLGTQHNFSTCGACGSKGMSSCHCQAMEADMVWPGDTAL